MSSSPTFRAGIERKAFKDDHGQVLPVKGERNVLITSALPYVNNAPHLGNVIGSVLSADVFARYSRTRNRRTLFICGTDEYGTTTETKALADGVSPRELCDKYHKIHANVYEWFQLSFDYFGRTSTPQQTEICQDIFLKLYRNGHLEEIETPQLYCEQNEKYLADRYVEGTCPICGYDDARGDQCDKCTNQINPIELINPRCKLCNSKPIVRNSSHLFIKLGDMQPQIEDFVKHASDNGVWSDNAIAMTRGWLKEGLKSRAMTRDLKWGVPVPLEGWEHKVMYVWFDAPIGYPSITACYTSEWEKWWKDPENVKLYQFMGKDNVPFHTLLFPAFLIGTDDSWVKLDSISTTEYLNYEGTKFSKSRNIGVFGENARDTGVPVEVWRYFLLSQRPEGSDSQFTWNEFVAHNNGELLNNLGNFVNRLLKFANAKYESVLPDPLGAGPAEDADFFTGSLEAELRDDLNQLIERYIKEMEVFHMRAGLEMVMSVSRRGNVYLQKCELGNDLLAKDPKRCATVVLVAANIIYLLSAMVHPFMPSTSDAILLQLNLPERSLPESFTIDVFPGHRIGKADYLFKRIEPKMEEVWRKQYGGVGAGSTAPDPAVDAKKARKLAAKNKNTTPAFEGPKPPEMIVLEDKIKEQGEKVRQVKAGTVEGVVPVEVASLMALKEELNTLITRLSQTTLSSA